MTFEDLARDKKCRVLAEYLISKLIVTMENAPDLWESAAREAKLNPPSDKSKALVIEMLREAAAAILNQQVAV